MLQQTRVETVLPFYRTFLDRFPTVGSLAGAELDEVLPLWSGLGYYRRCRQMHQAARRIEAIGRFPSTVEDLRELSGIGEYTAAAIASIAFGVAVPVLDGNVERVIGRRLAMTEDPRSRGGRQRLLEAAAELLDPGRPGDSNQALMELGATVCSPRSPRCFDCPIAAGCQALAEGSPERFPPPRVRKKPVRVRQAAVIVEAEGRWLLFRRAEESRLLAGIWELPWVELEADEAIGAAEAKLAARYGGTWNIGPYRTTVKHGITFRSISVEVYSGRVEPSGVLEKGARAEWYSPAERRGLASSSLLSKIETALNGATATPPRARSLRRRA